MSKKRKGPSLWSRIRQRIMNWALAPMGEHCFHEVNDPRCDGVEKTGTRSAIFTAVLMGYDDKDEKRSDAYKYIERNRARICCRCLQRQPQKDQAQIDGCRADGVKAAVENLIAEKSPQGAD